MLEGVSYILMNSPKRPDGPVVRDGKPYSQIAHLAEDVTPFIAMALGLRARGFSAPAIFAADRAAGLAVIEDLGDELVVAGEPPAPIEARYAVAAELLAELHREQLPETLPVEAGVEYKLPRYDMEALLIETELLLDWYLPKLQAKVSDAKRDLYMALWRDALTPVIEAPATWVLRDFHSPNLLWLPEREGVSRIGLLDFQDAVLGHGAYDVASLLQDARVDVPEMMEIALLVALHARALCRRQELSTRPPSRAPMPRSPRSAPARSSAFSPAWSGATASRNICAICRASGATCNARWRIRRWRRSTAGTAPTCRR